MNVNFSQGVSLRDTERTGETSERGGPFELEIVSCPKDVTCFIVDLATCVEDVQLACCTRQVEVANCSIVLKPMSVATETLL